MPKILLVILGLMCQSLLAQEVVIDTTKSINLDDLVVSANKIPEERRYVAQQIQIISAQTIQKMNAQTTADLLLNTGVVAMQKSQQGGGSPIIRGFEASRVLLLVDGVRLNNLIYRAGHLQNVITIDNNLLERTEVLFGPATTVYGSDALGGAVHFFTRKPEVNDARKITGSTFTRVATSNNEFTYHADLHMSMKKWAILASFTNSNFGDLKMGKRNNPAIDSAFGTRPFYVRRKADNSGDEIVTNPNKYRQKFSGYEQWDGLLKVLFQPRAKVQHLLNIQYSTSSNIPRYDRLTDPNGSGLAFAEWHYGPQTRFLGAYSLKMSDLGRFANNATLTLSQQLVKESRHNRRFNDNNLRHQTEVVHATGLTIDFNKNSTRHNLRYGVDVQFSKVASSAYQANIVSGEKSSFETRYPDGGNRMTLAAVYATHTFIIKPQLTLNDGVRVGGTWLQSAFEDKTFFPFPFDEISQQNFTWSGNIGLIYTPGSWKLSTMLSSGFRAPNVDDLTKVFDSRAGSASATGRLVVPNPNLKPEKTLNLDLSMTKYFGSRFKIEGVVFGTRFYDAIVVLPSTFNGQTTIQYNGFPADIYASKNQSKAIIWGTTLGFKGEFSKTFSATASYNQTHGTVKSEPNYALDHIPPAYGRLGLQFNKTNFNAEIYSLFNTWKKIEDFSPSGEDNAQYATAKGMPSWITFNVRMNIEATKWLTLQAGIDNLLDLQYRMFASGINAPGRNIFVTLKTRF